MGKPMSLTGAPAYGNQVIEAIIDNREIAHASAVRALAKYKFWMYGYHAAQWVLLNRCLKGTPWHQSSPFSMFVELAEIERGELDDARPFEIHKAKQRQQQHAAELAEPTQETNT